MCQLIDYIRKYKNEESDSALYIIERLKPLLNKYAYKLRYEDAYYDLQIFVIDCLKKIQIESMNNKTNGAIIKYFEKALYNEYIRLSKLKCVISTYEMLEEDTRIIDCAGSMEDDHSKLLFDSLKFCLTDREFEVIHNIFYDNMAVKEISEQTGQSIWNIYKLKESALDKLRRYILK